MPEALTLNIARDFTKFPSGRDEKDGPYNGTKFRRSLLLPRLEQARSSGVDLVVELDGVLSFGSSFLEESFGGLIRREGVSRSELDRILRIEPGWEGNTRYKEAILRYIRDARAGD